jgi:hypothetical protein
VDFKTYSNLAGKHAFLSASDYHWIHYSESKLERVYMSRMEAQLGTKKHAFAHQAIEMGIKLPETEQTLNLYVNHGIGYKMTCEQPLVYSDYCFGTADTIAFKRNKLRIHDLKTGVNEASFHQLEIYAALFCHDYEMSPFHIEIELRIYQNDSFMVLIPEPVEIDLIMKKMVTFNRIIEDMQREVL